MMVFAVIATSLAPHLTSVVPNLAASPRLSWRALIKYWHVAGANATTQCFGWAQLCLNCLQL
ncbi:hypothetical protein L210DRAFT_3554330 [Boletus edulis BED1]|uniref:Secreted protein n=1 Tax=Boletus edulis BED1 TaxID=1328754 RepID=A0AAD4BMH2_BOLED|nr:hypothetical protein L210DRAFT_3578798 [Boletus edulis BED1]KAF8434186.1 hypothetical protein L210DRAFT_3554330 [Boletus edulis BED1]